MLGRANSCFALHSALAVLIAALALREAPQASLFAACALATGDMTDVTPVGVDGCPTTLLQLDAALASDGLCLPVVYVDERLRIESPLT